MGDMTIRPEDAPKVTHVVTESEVLENLPRGLDEGDTADLRITDSTLRDGSHAMAHQYTEEQVRGVVSALDAAGVQVIEVSHGDGLGGSSFNYGFSKVDEFDLIKAAVEEATQAKIAILMLPGLGTVHDLKKAHAMGASVARIATHCTEADVSIQHFGEARKLGMETVGFLMLSHRASPQKLAEQARIMVDAGCECVYVVDSAGALVLETAQERIKAVIDEIGHEAQVGFHGHQNLSMGVANSVLAYQAGAKQIDGALCALGPGPATRRPRCSRRPSSGWGSGPGSTWARCSPPPRTSVAPSSRACRGWTGRRSPRGMPGCTPRSCCTPSGRPTATRCRRTRSSSGSASLGYVGGQEDMIIDIALQPPGGGRAGGGLYEAAPAGVR